MREEVLEILLDFNRELKEINERLNKLEGGK